MGIKIAGAVLAIDGFIKNAIYVGLKVGNNEVSGNNYARQKIDPAKWTKSTLTNNTIREAKNTDKIIFPTTSGGWGDITKFGLFDALTSGNEIADFDVSGNPDEITQTGTVVEVAAGAIKIRYSIV